MAVQRVKIPMVGGSYKHPTLPFDSQETINLFPERGGPQSKSPAILRRTPGLKNWVTVSAGSGPINGIYETSGGRLFAVRSNQLVELTSGLVETVMGTINITTGRIEMTDNGIELGVADGENIWSLVLATNVLTVVSSVNAPDNTPSLEFIDGYIFGFNPSSAQIGTFSHSDLNDLTTWNAIERVHLIRLFLLRPATDNYGYLAQRALKSGMMLVVTM